MKIILQLSILLFFIVTTACVSNKDNPVSIEPPVEVSFADDVLPIFTSSCGGSGCHGGNGSNGVTLTSYQSTINSVGSQYGSAVVNAGNADSSPLVDKLGSSPQFGSRMPLGGSPLSASQIAIISSWINDGAQNN